MGTIPQVALPGSVMGRAENPKGRHAGFHGSHSHQAVRDLDTLFNRSHVFRLELGM